MELHERTDFGTRIHLDLRSFFTILIFFFIFLSPSICLAVEKPSLLNNNGEGSLEDYKDRISQGADVNEEDEWSNTPLIYAALRGDYKLVQFLIDAGAKIHARNQLGQTPLLATCSGNFASEKNCRETARILIAAGSNINDQDANGATPLMLALQFWTANSQMLDVLLKANPNVALLDTKGRNALFFSAVHDVEISRQLIEKGADILVSDEEGGNVLMSAAEARNLPLIKLCIEKGIRTQYQ